MDPTATQYPGTPNKPVQLLPVIAEYIGVRPGYCGSEPHILGHRIKVKHIAVWHERMGMTPSEIVRTYPTITLSQVHSALAHDYDHPGEIEADIAEEGGSSRR
ncbi:MAG: DUF433 domain-containing protein [Singulisphaera sp.]